MPTVRYTADGGHYRVGGHGFEPGDERDVDDELAGYLADHGDFEVVDDAGGDDVHEEDGPPDEGANPPFDPSKSTVDELEAALKETNHHQVALEALLEAEKDGKDRETAKEAIEAALQQED